MAGCYTLFAMRTPGDKKATTVRLTPDTKALLENAARLKKSSESAIAEQAIIEFCRNHGITHTRYMMRASNTCYVLVRQQGDQFEVLDQQIRNGVPIQAIRETYEGRFNSPVDLVIDNGE